MTPDHHARLDAIVTASGLRRGPITDLAGGAKAPLRIHGVLEATLTVGGSASSVIITIAGTPAQIAAWLASKERAVA
jgi:hypothetical protein